MVTSVLGVKPSRETLYVERRFGENQKTSDEHAAAPGSEKSMVHGKSIS
jgi:hypothetical protein